MLSELELKAWRPQFRHKCMKDSDYTKLTKVCNLEVQLSAAWERYEDIRETLVTVLCDAPEERNAENLYHGKQLAQYQ